MRTTFFLAAILFFYQISQGQSLRSDERIDKPVHFRLAYMGTLSYPGVKAGVEYPILTKHYLNLVDSLFVLTKTKQRSLTLNLGWYHHKTFHSNYILTVGYLWRRTNKGGWFADIEPQLGISRTFIDGTVYSVDPNNVVNKIQLAGDWFLASQLSFSVGKELLLAKNEVPIKIYLRPTLILLTPYNNFIYVRPSVEIGAIYDFKGLWKVRSTDTKIFK
ncbi:hypothetical protein [Algoriphagus sp. A40]|uniref:hypothetical protein n=1 Tax=Algoriphagus sp. A40 TaxID=1945863 RepID=UPI00098785A1|nr:hypothetical protein [Algoriphagus sp. A40]OOG71898.1 hypothetical protein B0E43_16580 [Algoriphagus sp. A40]